MNHNLTNIEFTRVCELISDYLGLNFLNERRQNLSRILTLAARDFGFLTLGSFVQWLLSASVNRNQIEMLASYLTNSETYFWREPMVFDSLVRNIIKDLVASKKEGEKILNVWCAGCSTGEEAYSIAIAVHRSIPKTEKWNINIVATDINAKSLSKARLGIYSSWSFRNSPPWLKSKYFKNLDNNHYQIIPEIMEMVTFSAFNLTREDYLSTICRNRKMDIIFCRNVLMYFTNEWAVKASQNLFDSLSDGGWLAVSSCELSSDLFKHFKPVNFPGAVLYCKTKQVEILQPTPSPLLPSSPSPFLPLTPSPFRTINIEVTAPEALLCDNIISIRSLADQGHLEEALSVCNEAIEFDKLSPSLYLLRSSILQELEKYHDAIKSLKQAIYIDPEYIMGHFTLGNIFIRQGIIHNAERYFNNALHLLNSIPDDDIPAESEGLSAKHIREIILNRLQKQVSI